MTRLARRRGVTMDFAMEQPPPGHPRGANLLMGLSGVEPLTSRLSVPERETEIHSSQHFTPARQAEIFPKMAQNVPKTQNPTRNPRNRNVTFSPPRRLGRRASGHGHPSARRMALRAAPNRLVSALGAGSRAVTRQIGGPSRVSKG